MNPIKYAFDAVGGRSKAAALLNRTYMAMSKMEKRGYYQELNIRAKPNMPRYLQLIAVESLRLNGYLRMLSQSRL